MSINNKKLIQDLADQHNIIRTNPSSYIPLLEKQMLNFKGNILYKPSSKVGIETNEGKMAYQECINFLKKQKPIGKIELNSDLSKASQDHVDDIGPKGICDHTGTDGSAPSDRIEKYIDWGITMGENIDFGANTAQEIIISLIVDDGVSDRGHRNAIFNPKFKFLGAANGKHTEFETCTVINYVGEINNIVSEKLDKTKQIIKNASKQITDNNSNSKFNKGKTELHNNSKVSTKETSIINSNNKNNVSKDKDEVSLIKDLMKEKLKMKDYKSKLDSKVKSTDNQDSEDYKPAGTVKTEVKTTIKTSNGKRVTTTVKTFTLKDGSQEIVEEVVTEELR